MRMKTVGRKVREVDSIEEIDNLFEAAWVVRGTRGLVPKGVYRFRTFEEAGTWMMRAMARTHEYLTRGTPRSSAALSTTSEPVTS